ERDAHRRSLHANLFDRRHALADLHIDGERFLSRLAAPDLAPPGRCPALEAPQQLLDVESGKRALSAGQVGGAVERLGQLVDVAAGTVEGEGQRAFAFEPPETDQFAETALEVDVGELELRLERGCGRGR